MASQTGMTGGRRVVWITHKSGERCEGCGAEFFKGDFVQINREEGIRCMTCAGLAHLVFLPAGDPALLGTLRLWWLHGNRSVSRRTAPARR